MNEIFLLDVQKVLIEYLSNIIYIYTYIVNKVYQGHMSKKYVQEGRSDLVEAWMQA